MEQRFAVHAGDDTEALTRLAEPGAARAGVGPRSRRLGRQALQLALVGAVLSAASVADARPKRRDAKAAFDRGVTAYKKHNYEAASVALARSFELEHDPDTLFAWAQAQRQLTNCGKAVELYDMLLGFDLPAKNRAAVEAQLAECRDLIAAQQPRVTPLPDDPVVEPKAVPPPPPPEPRVVERPVVAPAPAAVVVAPATVVRPWYKDPVTIGLVGGGLLVTAIGGGVVLSAWSLDKDSNTVFNHNQYDSAQSLADKAKSRGTLGVVTMSVGGVLVLGGAVWIAMRPSNKEHMVTGWVAPDGGGLAVAGAF